MNKDSSETVIKSPTPTTAQALSRGLIFNLHHFREFWCGIHNSAQCSKKKEKEL